MPTAAILAIGDELVDGRIVNSNAAWLAGQLGAVGLVPVAHHTVGDPLQPLSEAVQALLGRVDLVVMTGGLGPTGDDRTREAIARATQRSLVEDPAELEHLEGIFQRLGREMPRQNRKQATRPEGAEVLRNPLGTAPGLLLHHQETVLVAMPGVPHEMKRMWEEEALPRVLELLPRGGGWATARVSCFGWSESRLDAQIGPQLLALKGVDYGIRATRGEMRFSLKAAGNTQEEADTQLQRALARLNEVLGPTRYADCERPLYERTAELLLQSGQTVAVAESCTGGSLGRELVRVPGMSAVFLGGVVSYANSAKTDLLGVSEAMLDEHGAVSEPVARAMAAGVRERLGADLGVGITGIAGPSGGSPQKPVGTVHLALAHPEGTAHRRVRLPGDRERVQLYATQAGLDLIRRHLEGTLEDDG